MQASAERHRYPGNFPGNFQEKNILVNNYFLDIRAKPRGHSTGMGKGHIINAR
ncbi:MAG: hypothetical protein DID89_2727547926 [Candidatus Nitrotoga sp. CP45]|nr:MAG: hypothetical protein DID89_2727547926 [Candidatus Nitrotoga sp. CP45]